MGCGDDDTLEMVVVVVRVMVRGDGDNGETVDNLVIVVVAMVKMVMVNMILFDVKTLNLTFFFLMYL